MTLFKNLRELLGATSTAPKRTAGKASADGMCLCMVVSEQEGAEIWVQGVRTNFVTPKLVAIAKDQPVDIEVRLVGHENHKASVRSSHDLTYYYCNLKRIPFKLISGGIAAHENRASAYL